MKKWLAALCALALLAGCRVPAAETPAPSQSPAEKPVETDRGTLSLEDIARVNEAFAATEMKDGGCYARQVNGFFTSFYETPEELDFSEFLYYYPGDGILETEDQAEFDALMALPGCWWSAENFGKETLTVGDLPVPTRRILRSSVDKTLERYAGITTADLTNTDGVLYLADYDAYYTFTSDFGPGQFLCAGGEVDGDTALLWTDWGDWGDESVRRELRLEKQGENWLIRSHQKAWKDKRTSLEGILANLQENDIRGGELLTPALYPREDLMAALVRRAVRNNAVYSNYEYANNDWKDILRNWAFYIGPVGQTGLDEGKRVQIAVGPAENLVKITGGADLPDDVVCVKDAALYRLLTNVDVEKDIDQVAYEKYMIPVVNYFNDCVTGRRTDGDYAVFPFHAWEMDRFVQVGESGDGRAQLYEIAVAYQANTVEEALMVLNGDAYVDGLLWVHNWGQPVYLLAVDGEVAHFADETNSQEADLDGDGQMEFLVYQPGVRAVTLYDCVDGALKVLDVNKALGADGSDFAGNVGNLQLPYRDCITAYFGPAGTGKTKVYRYLPEGTLEYICPLEDALLK